MLALERETGCARLYSADLLSRWNEDMSGTGARMEPNSSQCL